MRVVVDWLDAAAMLIFLAWLLLGFLEMLGRLAWRVVAAPWRRR